MENYKVSNYNYLNILNNMYDGLYFVDSARIITFWNKAAERISGYTAAEVIGRSCADSILTHIDCDGNYLCEMECPLLATIEDCQQREDVLYMHHKDGHRIPVSVRTSPLLDGDGRIIGGIEIFTDVSNQEGNSLLIKELEKLALLDGLTNLANRRYIEQEIEGRLAELQRFKMPFGILFIDIDFFKRVNDTYGHPIGDEVLRFVAKTFVANSRPFDLYGRWGGEEFIGIIRNVKSPELEEIAERLRLLIERSYLMHEAIKLQVTISIGIAAGVADDSLETLIQRADKNLYLSKTNGRNRVTFS